MGKKYDKLITVDVVCHAVPSPLVWRKYIEYQKQKLDIDKIDKILFRDKRKYGYKYSTMTIESKDKVYAMGVETDPYLRAFFGDLSDRPACYQCKFKKQYRVSDFTIWDCFVVENFDKSLDDDKGTTSILIHSEKGKNVFKAIENKINCKNIKVDDLVKNVKEMYDSVSINSKRKQFFKDINNIKGQEFFNKYFSNNFKSKTERNIRIFLVKTGLYKKIKKVVKKILRR